MGCCLYVKYREKIAKLIYKPDELVVSGPDAKLSAGLSPHICCVSWMK